MKRLGLLLIICSGMLSATSQTIAYRNLKDLTTAGGDTISHEITVEKRGKNQIMLTNGADYKLSSKRKFIDKSIKYRYYAVSIDNDLYVNCKKLKIKKFRFGKYYAPAMWVNGQIYFCARPIGPAAVSLSTDKNIGMGYIGDAINNSSMISERVFYEINSETGIIEFVGKDKMLALLADYPDLEEEYLKADNEEAKTAKSFLIELKKRLE